MRQMVIRITDKSEDAQLLYKRGGKELWKTIALDRLSELISNAVIQHQSGEKPQMLDKRIIAIGNSSMIFHTPETKRLVFYKGKSFEINYPPCIYRVTYTSDRIRDIWCYTFFRYAGADTELFCMPMPNMTGSDHMCIGTADRNIIDGNVIEAVGRIVDAEYTHDHVDNLKEQTSTLKWFRYLKNHKVKRSDLKKSVGRLRDYVKT